MPKVRCTSAWISMLMVVAIVCMFVLLWVALPLELPPTEASQDMRTNAIERGDNNDLAERKEYVKVLLGQLNRERRAGQKIALWDWEIDWLSRHKSLAAIKEEFTKLYTLKVELAERPPTGREKVGSESILAMGGAKTPLLICFTLALILHILDDYL